MGKQSENASNSVEKSRYDYFEKIKYGRGNPVIAKVSKPVYDAHYVLNRFIDSLSNKLKTWRGALGDVELEDKTKLDNKDTKLRPIFTMTQKLNYLVVTSTKRYLGSIIDFLDRLSGKFDSSGIEKNTRNATISSANNLLNSGMFVDKSKKVFDSVPQSTFAGKIPYESKYEMYAPFFDANPIYRYCNDQFSTHIKNRIKELDIDIADPTDLNIASIPFHELEFAQAKYFRSMASLMENRELKARLNQVWNLYDGVSQTEILLQKTILCPIHCSIFEANQIKSRMSTIDIFGDGGVIEGMFYDEQISTEKNKIVDKMNKKLYSQDELYPSYDSGWKIEFIQGVFEIILKYDDLLESSPMRHMDSSKISEIKKDGRLMEKQIESSFSQADIEHYKIALNFLTSYRLITKYMPK